jgi:type IV pilus assembly protein PilE
MRMRVNQSGMTLVELMIVIAIVAVLTTIAVPGYRHYVIRANRADAKAGLLSVAAQLERCYTRFSSYTADDCPVDLPVDSPDGKYQIKEDTGPDPDEPVAGITESTFALLAVPVGAQEQDKNCAGFRLDHRNKKSVTGEAAAADCWGR